MQPLIILDGGMGRELHRRNAPFRQPEWSALALMETPDIVRDVHLDYIRAGANVITTNSYAVVPFHIGERFYQRGEQLAALAGKLAREAVQKSGKAVLVAGSLPPLFGSYRPDLFNADLAESLAKPLIQGLSPYVDLWLAETQSSIIEVQTWKRLLGNDQRPFWCSFTLDDSAQQTEPKLRSGELVVDAVKQALALNAATISFNCSQIEVMAAALTQAKQVIDQQQRAVNLGVYANAFVPQPEEMQAANEAIDEIRRDSTPENYLYWAQKWRAIGANVIGGCCGIGPEHIAQLATHLR
ncbi:homocysteine S-methyltransferase family protein [Gallibacterium salpingitidis]|uniref:Homocysteine methyltransferase n=1 Tax=Gallibacterium salpingitidis TaxID=505341 RepID=A0A1A7P3R0_9PAST|nr:homocysteine S-methyltransferase family protein [Gallibacterium salpingitidis]OBW95859.1 homocysteine methyltransferase [Gallibacterium salpingitidis]